MTVLEYLVIAIVIGAIVFGIAVVVFGRGEQMAALPARTSPSELPASGIRGNHVREVRFGLALRGYRMSDVDWTLERLADEIDLLRAQLAQHAADDPAGSGETTAREADQDTDQQPIQRSEWQDDTPRDASGLLSASVTAALTQTESHDAHDGPDTARRDSDTERFE